MKIIKEKRAIAYLDVMGFKAKIENEDIENIATYYEKFLDNTDGYARIDENNGGIVREQKCIRYIFSDSIFLIANEDSEKGFIDLFTQVWRMMQISIASGYPLRGAITYGDIFVNLEKNIFLGKPLSKAVMLEGQQNWIGIVVDDTVISRYEAIFDEQEKLSGLYSLILPKYDVPFKDGELYNMNVINWRVNMISQDGIKSLFKNEPYDKKVEEKINNTLFFSKLVVDNKIAYLNDDMVPQEYRKFFIAKGDPNIYGVPRENGDEY